MHASATLRTQINLFTENSKLLSQANLKAHWYDTQNPFDPSTQHHKYDSALEHKRNTFLLLTQDQMHHKTEKQNFMFSRC